MSKSEQANKKRCAWVTRHHPTRSQSSELRSAGYNIIFIPTRERKADLILSWIRYKLCSDPDLIIAAHPIGTLHHLARLAPCPVLIAEMDYDYQQPKWTGIWKRVIKTKLITETFILEEQSP